VSRAQLSFSQFQNALHDGRLRRLLSLPLVKLREGLEASNQAWVVWAESFGFLDCSLEQFLCLIVTPLLDSRAGRVHTLFPQGLLSEGDD
jgi:hypothetical protein